METQLLIFLHYFKECDLSVGRMNDLHAGPIGSEGYNEYLADYFTFLYYDKLMPETCIEPVTTSVHGTIPWHSQKGLDPMDRLFLAITMQAVDDYLKYLEKGMCLAAAILANEYFTRCPMLEQLFDGIEKRLVQKQYEPRAIKSLRVELWHNYHEYLKEATNIYE